MEIDHVKINLVYKSIALKALESIKIKLFLSPYNYAKYENKRPMITRYPFTTDIFVAFIYKVSL